MACVEDLYIYKGEAFKNSLSFAYRKLSADFSHFLGHTFVSYFHPIVIIIGIIFIKQYSQKYDAKYRLVENI